MTSGKLERIMMVEDEADIQLIAGMALESLGGFVVKICGNGRDAVQTALEFNPNLILLDVMMPGMDGPATLRVLRETPATAPVPIIFMTAKVQPHEVDYYRSIGALDVIAKPFNPMTLAAMVKAIWTQSYG